MSQLSNGEKEMMNIFHHFKLVEGKGIMYQNIRAVQDKYISPPIMVPFFRTTKLKI